MTNNNISGIIKKNKQRGVKKMLKLQEIELELIEELKEIAEEFMYMSRYAKTQETADIMTDLRRSLIKVTDSALDYDLEQFNNNWQELKYTLVDLENAIHEERDEADRLGRESPILNKLDKSLMDVHNFEVWNIDRMTKQPVVY